MDYSLNGHLKQTYTSIQEWQPRDQKRVKWSKVFFCRSGYVRYKIYAPQSKI